MKNLSFVSPSSRRALSVGALALAAALMAGGSTNSSGSATPKGQERFVRETAIARALVARMTLEEKVGQMMQVDQANLKDPQDVAKYALGSLLSGGGSGPKRKEDYNLKGWSDLLANYQRIARSTRLGIPLLYGIDSVHGNNNIPGATIYPHNIGLGATRDASLVRRIARVTAEETRAIGANWAFAPCVTVPQDVRWGRTYEGFSEDPALVRRLGVAAVEGLQGDSLADSGTVLACAKHFVGDGGTTFGTGGRDRRSGLDQGDTRIDEATLRRIHLQGYLGAIPAGVGSVMPSYSSWNGLKCSANRHLLTDVLKRELGFQGIVISDYDAIDQIGPDYKEDIATSVNAGMDMVMMTRQYATFAKDLVELVHEGKVPMSRIDDAVTRILRVKAAAGLLGPKSNVAPNPKFQAEFGSPAHRALARTAVRESLVLLKNDRRTLPLRKDVARIHVCGRGADNIGMQCGGWTTSWQGSLANDVPGSTTILAAIRATVSQRTAVTYSEDGHGVEGADVAVVVVGERPYAEMRGDTADPSLSKDDLQLIASLKRARVPTVVVTLSGRPLVLGDALGDADALVSAWLPGSEGQGVADVLFGDARPTGKLAFPWPRTVAQLPLKLNGDDPQFPYGFGLTYGR